MPNSEEDNDNSLETTTVTFLTVNDVYDILPNDDGLGGIPQLTTLLKQEQQKCKEEGSLSKCITTINGDFLSASQAAVIYKGSHMIQLLNDIKIDYAVVGNHEFDFGDDVLIERIRESKFTFLGSNIRDCKSGNIFTGLVDNTCFICPDSGIVFGIFGLCTRETPNLSFPSDKVEFQDVVLTARRCVAGLEKKGAQVIVAITHLSIAHDKVLAKKVPGIHLIIGGHDHQPITMFQGETMIHKSGQNAYWLGRIDLHVTVKNGENITVIPSWRMILNKNIPPDPDCLKTVNNLLANIHDPDEEEKNKQFLAVSTYPLDTRYATVRGKQSNFANLVADALRAEMKADFGLINGGYIRGDKLYDAKSQITIGVIKKEMPFSTYPAVLVQLKGRYLKQAIEQHLSPYPLLSGSFPHLSSGFHKVVYQANKKEIISMNIVNDNNTYEEICLDKDYFIATTRFIAIGGDAVTSWSNNGTIIKESSTVSQIVIDYLLKCRAINYPPEENRLVILEDDG